MFDEKEILEFWEKNKIFEKSVTQRKGKKNFVFYEGPPTANNVPHIGHFGGTRVFKDVVSDLKNKIFEKSVTQRKGKKNFVFYEGPPTANNVPHIGHFGGTRVFKDVVLRYKTMRGYYAPRRAGWDTQGLPVEVEVEKALGLK